MNPITITFNYERATKNMNRYNEVVAEGTAPIVGAFYIKTSSLPEGDVGPRTVVIS